MTIAALRALLQEIDEQGGPEAARQWRLNLPDPIEEGNIPMATPAPRSAPAPAPGPPRPAAPVMIDDPERIPVGKPLAWADAHPDPDVQDQSARARAAVTGLRRRYAADHELAAITSEKQQLQERLAQLQEREAELSPPQPKSRRAKSYNAAAIRGWARENNIPCPSSGRVPKAVVDAWREATGTPAAGSA